MRSYLLLFLSVAAIGLLSFSLSGGIVSNSAAAAPWLAEDATIVLKDGTKISGTIIKETEESITLKSEYGVVNIKRAKIKEIRRRFLTAFKYFETRNFECKPPTPIGTRQGLTVQVRNEPQRLFEVSLPE